MIKNIDLKDGTITYNDFHIDLTKPLEDQMWEIKEDLLQIQYNQNYLIDVGFYPEFDPSGTFGISVIKDCDWEKPLLKKQTKKEKFLETLQECIDFAAHLQT